MKKIGLICLALVLAVGALGVGFAMWSETLVIDTTVETGTYCIGFIDQKTNDPCVGPGDPGALHPRQEDPALPDYDGMLDPGIPEPGELPVRYDKNVGCCGCKLFDPEGEAMCVGYDGTLKRCHETMRIVMWNVYPCYHGVFGYRIGNCGTIPGQVIGAKIVAIGGEELVAPIPLPKCTAPPCEPVHVDLGGDAKFDVNILFLGPPDQQIDPCQSKEFHLAVHVIQGAPQLATLTFDIEIETVQWNEAP